MKDLQSSIRKEIKKFLPQAQKNVARLNKDAQKLMKKTEESLLEAYETTRKTTENLLFKAQREKLYCELGRAVLPLLSAEQLAQKRVAGPAREIKRLNRKIHSGK
jgi:siroheme synthase (precorrin-2 oxidase/ferrochelatase)